MLEKIWKFLTGEIGADNPELLAKVKLSESEVREIALSYAADKGFNSEDMTPPHLKVKNGRLVWQVAFGMVDENNLPVKGGHLFLVIDDISGVIIKKNKVVR